MWKYSILAGGLHVLPWVDLRSRGRFPPISAPVYPLQGRVLIGSGNVCPSHGLNTTARSERLTSTVPLRTVRKRRGFTFRILDEKQTDKRKICPAEFHSI